MLRLDLATHLVIALNLLKFINLPLLTNTMKSSLAFAVLAAVVQSTGAVKISAEEVSTVKAALAARLNAMSKCLP